MKMKKILIIVVLILFVMMFIKGNVPAYNMAEYYPLNQGNEWTYAFTFNNGPPMTTKGVINGTELVNGMDTIKLDFIMTEDSSLVESHNLVMYEDGLKQYKHVRVTNGVYSIYSSDSPWIMFPSPFDLGDVYQGTYSYSDYSLNDDTLLKTGTGSQTITLEEVEDVSVPFGIFNDCLRVFTSASWEASDGSYGLIEETFWYARNVGPIKTDFTFNVHLPGGDVTINTATELTDYNVEIPTGCPAIVALGEDSNDLGTLRKFRDEVLSKTPVGQEIIKLYYQWSPVIVRAMEADKEFKEDVKDLVDEILGVIE